MQSNRPKKKQKKKRPQQHQIELVKLVYPLVYKIWLMKRLPMIVSRNVIFLIHFWYIITHLDLFLIHFNWFFQVCKVKPRKCWMKQKKKCLNILKLQWKKLTIAKSLNYSSSSPETAETHHVTSLKWVMWCDYVIICGFPDLKNSLFIHYHCSILNSSLCSI